MNKKVFSGHQPNFLPYMGFFYKLFKSDVFVLDDDVQYSRGAYHNTNFLNVNGQKHRITIPVNYDFGNLINEVLISKEGNWKEKLLKTIKMNYSKYRFFEEGYELIEKHLNMDHDRLSDLNIGLIKDIAKRFGITTDIVIASKDVPTELMNQERNVYQCLQLGGNIYYSGVGGKSYNDEADYLSNGIELVYTDYEPVVYRGRKGFVENLSVLDYIFCNGFKIPEEWEEHHE